MGGQYNIIHLLSNYQQQCMIIEFRAEFLIQLKLRGQRKFLQSSFSCLLLSESAMARSMHIILMKEEYSHTETDFSGHWGAVQGIRHEKARGRSS